MTLTIAQLAQFNMPGGWEWLVIALFGLLIFGKRLPEVGKSLGKSIVEFKKGLRGIEDELENASRQDSHTRELPGPQSAETPHTTDDHTPDQKEAPPSEGASDHAAAPYTEQQGPDDSSSHLSSGI
jgi:sec-independent protein translocase protein TatA